VWLPSEVDVSIRRPDWFWSTTNASKVLSTDQLLSIYYRSVGRGAQLLLNIPPNREGLMDAKDRTSAAGLGRQLQQRFGSPLASTHGSGTELVLRLPHPQRIDTVILEEDIALGERVRAFTLEGRSSGRWVELGTGTAIGHKRIQPVQPQVVDSVRLRVTESAAEPGIRALQVFDTGSAPPADWAEEAELWAPNLAGHWQSGTFSLQLGNLIHDAAQYILRFRPSAGRVEGFEDVQLTVGGVASPQFVRHAEKQDELRLDITGLDKSIVLTGHVRGAGAGSVLLIRR
jgi:alpha-L-fucosidase